MDTLPHELVNRIVSFVERREGETQAYFHERKSLRANLPLLSALSRSFQEAVEAITFRNLDFKSTDLHDVRTILTPSRRSKLRSIYFTPVLPAYPEADCGRHETLRDQIANNESFSRSLKELFGLLKTWEDDGSREMIALHLYLPIDAFPREKSRHEYEMEVIKRERVDIFEERWKESYVRLTNFEDLPILEQVSKMSVSRLGARREYAPATVAQIASRLRRLESVEWELDDYDDPSPTEDDEVDSLDDIGTPEEVDELDRSALYTTSRRERRNELAEALMKTPLRSLQKANIELDYEARDDEAGDSTVLLTPSSPTDPLSAALHLLSQTLTTFDLKGTFDHSLFWPLSATDAVPRWPSLRTYRLTFSMCTPTGDYYFTRNPEAPPLSADSVGSSSPGTPRPFRTVPNDEHMGPLLLSFARAAQRMPVLELAVLTSSLTDEEYYYSQFEIRCMAPGKSALYGDEEAGDQISRRVHYEVGDWRPNEELAGMMREIGKEKWGGRAVEKFMESQY